MKLVKPLASSLFIPFLLSMAFGAQAATGNTVTGNGTSDSPFRIEMTKNLKFSSGESLNPLKLPGISTDAKNVYLIIHVPKGISTKIESMEVASVDVSQDDHNIMYGQFTGVDSKANNYPSKETVEYHGSNQCIGEPASVGQTCVIIKHDTSKVYTLESGYYKMTFALSSPLPNSVNIGVAFTASPNQANNFNEK